MVMSMQTTRCRYRCLRAAPDAIRVRYVRRNHPRPGQHSATAPIRCCPADAVLHHGSLPMPCSLLEAPAQRFPRSARPVRAARLRGSWSPPRTGDCSRNSAVNAVEAATRRFTTSTVPAGCSSCYPASGSPVLAARRRSGRIPGLPCRRCPARARSRCWSAAVDVSGRRHPGHGVSLQRGPWPAHHSRTRLRAGSCLRHEGVLVIGLAAYDDLRCSAASRSMRRMRPTSRAVLQ